jgi:serine/threonine protein kinase
MEKLLDKRYKIESVIKAGGMGTVYLAKDTASDNKLCAIKEMKDKFTDKISRQIAVNRFLTEIQTLSNFSHPNIPLITDHFLETNSFYFVMEFIEGTDLYAFLKKEGSPGLPENDVIGWMLQALDALIYIHNLKPPVIHRDIKPSNIILRKSDLKILLIDFGIARVTSPSDGSWIGTPGYASPEQQTGQHEARSDIYSLGATFFELLTGSKPEYQSVRDFKNNRSISRAVRNIILKALSVNVNDRFKNALEMKNEIISRMKIKYVESEKTDRFRFNEAVMNIRNKAIEPFLNNVIKSYSNECHEKWIPKNIDFFTFTMTGSSIFELIIKKNDTQGKIEFYEKQKLLDMQIIGEVDPLVENAVVDTKRILRKFIEDYEQYKNDGGICL